MLTDEHVEHLFIIYPDLWFPSVFITNSQSSPHHPYIFISFHPHPQPLPYIYLTPIINLKFDLCIGLDDFLFVWCNAWWLIQVAKQRGICVFASLPVADDSFHFICFSIAIKWTEYEVNEEFAFNQRRQRTRGLSRITCWPKTYIPRTADDHFNWPQNAVVH